MSGNPDQPHQVSEPLNELEYYRRVQQLEMENAILKDTLRHLAQTVHQAYHQNLGGGWHTCPKDVCSSAQRALPDYVLWLKGEGQRP